MPAKMLMSWDPKNRRWRKNYRGRQIPPVSCRQLAAWSGKPVPETKDGSYQVANAWWLEKKAEIDGATPDRYRDVVETLTRRLDWARRRGEPEAGLIGGCIEEIKRGKPAFVRFMTSDMALDEVEETNEGLRLVNELIRQHYPDGLFEGLDAVNLASQTWNDRVARDDPDPVPEERTLGALADRFLERERARVGSGLSPGGYANVRDRLAHLRGWLDDATAVDRIDATTWDNYFVFILRQEWSADHKRGVFRAARSLVSWLADTGVVPRPANLDRRYRFPDLRDDDDADIVPMPIPDLRRLVEAAEGTRAELHLLLMANCGFTSLDVSDLHPNEVRDGRIVRRRSKTRRYRRPPLVDYKLWPRTATLLDRFRTADPDHVLLSGRGTPLAGRRLDETEKVRRKDNVALAIRRLSKKLKIVHPPKSIRKRSATLIREDARFADLRGHFLGHAPDSIADGHYAAPPRGRFDECITWLGEQYGLM